MRHVRGMRVREVQAMRRRWTLNWAAALILSLALATIALPSRQAAASPSAKQDSVSAMAASSFSLATASAPTTSLPDAPVEAPLKELTDSGVTKPIDEVFSRIAGGDQVSWLEMVKGIFAGKGLDFRALFGAFGRGIASDLLINSKVLGRIILIGVVIACLDVLTDTIAPGGSSKIAAWASHLALVTLAIMSFREVLGIARGALDTVKTAFFAFIPSLTSLSLVSGAPVTASVLHPLVFGMGTVVSVYVVDVAFPLIYTSIALDLAGNLTGGERAGGVAAMLRQVAFLGTGLLMACFVGAVVGQKAATGLADGMAFRTAKYVTSTFVPLVGKPIGDTMDMFFVSAYSLRSALGIVGSIALLAAVFSPFLQILSCLVVWRVSAAVLGPLCGSPVAKSLKSMADGVLTLATSVLVTSFCFVICLSLVAHAVKPF